VSEVTVKKVLKANARGRILSRSNCGLLPGFFRVFTLQFDSPNDANSPSKYVLALLGEKKRQSRWFAELAGLQFPAALTHHGEEEPTLRPRPAFIRPGIEVSR